jgi:hypothetical protein
MTFAELGETHTALGNLQQALTFFEDETRLFEELYAAYPANVSFKNGLAISYEKLGETHTALGKGFWVWCSGISRVCNRISEMELGYRTTRSCPITAPGELSYPITRSYPIT